ncbi:PH domain-containing protein [Roseimaritima sediminicola]|uniref:PH domain-containing protein n=1 Tax=Roseimaritima sediminicola TaxID=2662066 RepID=UPI00192A54D4|nr:PH domain-containing protein [Roseimaritima sediminicola]
MDQPFDVRRIQRPDKALLWYYVLCALATGPAFPIVLVPLLCRYYTLRYRFDDRGICLSWGVLFRAETYLTYKRIQDIHLNRNLVQRWFGLANLTVQTASGSAAPEMKIEGVLEAEALRDYLYGMMRGARESAVHGSPDDLTTDAAADPAVMAAAATPGGDDEVLQLLCSIRDSVRRLADSRGSSAEQS